MQFFRAQIDLTDDYVVIALFGDGAWESGVQRVQVGMRTVCNVPRSFFWLHVKSDP
jgi:hypothetical protein